MLVIREQLLAERVYDHAVYWIGFMINEYNYVFIWYILECVLLLTLIIVVPKIKLACMPYLSSSLCTKIHAHIRLLTHSCSDDYQEKQRLALRSTKSEIMTV